jgi:hypothetical protein
MTPIEAGKAATVLIGQFLNSSKGDEIFTRSLAALLTNFSRSVVEDCINAKSGYATTAEFLSICQVNQWCNARAERYSEIIDQQKRRAEQLTQRNAAQPKTERGMAITRAWLDRTDPAARTLSGQKSKTETERQLAAKARAKLIAEFGQSAFDAAPDQPNTFRRFT